MNSEIDKKNKSMTFYLMYDEDLKGLKFEEKEEEKKELIVF